MAFKLEMFSDFVCPFCYIGLATVRKLQPSLALNLSRAPSRSIRNGRPKGCRSRSTHA